MLLFYHGQKKWLTTCSQGGTNQAILLVQARVKIWQVLCSIYSDGRQLNAALVAKVEGTAKIRSLLSWGISSLAGLLFIASVPHAFAAPTKSTYATLGTATSAPAGYEQFCRDTPSDCSYEAAEPKDVVLSKTTWRDLQAVNDRINRAVEPVTDQENYGKTEVWSYPRDKKGDCEDYVLLKRKLLIASGWPSSALLITVVRDKKGDGHAVLTVKTDRGEFILDNQESRVLPWQETGYRFVKRQSQTNPNVWVSLGESSTPAAVAAQGD